MLAPRNKRLMLIASVFLVVGLTTFFVFRIISRRAEGPVYNGVTLETWIERFHFASTTSAGSLQAQADCNRAKAAIQAIGTNAFPYLLKWMEYEEPKIKSTARFILNDSLSQVGLNKFEMEDTKSARAYRSAFSLALFAPEATNIVTEVTRIFQDPRNQAPEGPWNHAGFLLVRFGGVGAKALATTLTNADPVLQEMAIRYLANMGKEGAPAVPALIKALDSEHPAVVSETTRAIGVIGVEPDLCVPPLIERLGRIDFPFKTGAALALGYFGSNALSAIPILVKTRDENEDPLRRVCVKSLHRIDPGSFTNAPPQSNDGGNNYGGFASPR